jgi:hypothetical protein
MTDYLTNQLTRLLICSIDGVAKVSVSNLPVVQTPAPAVAPALPKTAPAVVTKAKSPTSKEDNIAKLKNMTSDFWSQM